MRFKLDENLGEQVRDLFRQAGHRAETVQREKLCGADDRSLIERCRKEGRCLVTFDLDYANPLIFPPDEYPGIVVLRIKGRCTRVLLQRLLRLLLDGLAVGTVAARLWIVSEKGIREYSPEQ